jgi:hypothetical protein
MTKLVVLLSAFCVEAQHEELWHITPAKSAELTADEDCRTSNRFLLSEYHERRGDL